MRLLVALVCAALVGCAFAAQSPTMVISGVVRDQAANYMAHAKYPNDYWVYNGWTDEPTSGSCGIANGGQGFPNTDFELPLYMYGTIQKQNAPGGVLYNGEPGLVGGECNTTNKFSNCGTLGADNKPVYQYPGTSPFGTIQSPTSFGTWFNDGPTTVNIPVNITMTLVSGRTYTFDEQYYFPIDGQGWQDNNLGGDGKTHNFNFCFEFHGNFAYQGGEVFSFAGDDDMWVYIGGLLVIDLGGIHTALTASVSLDKMGLTLLQIYPLDIFYCERHTVASEITITTSIQVICTYYDWCNICEGDGQSCCTAQDILTCNDNNACTNDTCAITTPPNIGCAHTDITCNDNNFCTTDTCNPSSGCTFTPITCNDNNDCTTDTCNPSSGCVYTKQTCPGDSCNIAGCSTTSGCFTTPQTCNDSNACTADSCNPSSGCAFNAITCNDNNACTTDTCNKATGCVFTPITCNDNNDCTQDTCLTASGCSYTTITCNDNNACTTDTCSKTSGCSYTNITCNDNSECTTDSCNTASGCAYTPITCNDNNACTTDTCLAASGCKFTPITCNDNNECTTDSCDPVAGCTYTPIVCNDNDACTNDSCIAASGCKYTPFTCNDNNACTTDSCSTTSGCSFATITCNDNNPCTADSCSTTAGCQYVPQDCDHCNSTGVAVTCTPQNGNFCLPLECNPSTGACTVLNAVVCFDGNDCTQDLCASNNGSCYYPNIPCDDGDLCTIDSCDPSSGCTSTKVGCDDGNPCTTDTCVPTTGNCSHVAVAGNCLPCGATACTWTNACNPDTCVNDVCTPSPVTCDDGNNCTTDSCVNHNNYSSCDFAPVICTTVGACDPLSCNPLTGSCASLNPVTCDDQNPCTTDSCTSVNAANYTCNNLLNSCGTKDLCQPQSCNISTGNCDATPIVCDDNNVCTTDSCASNTTAAYCVFTPVTCTSSLDSCTPDFCNATDNVGCQAPATSSCDDGNPCTVDTCNEQWANCSHVPGPVCDDGNACTVDVCDGTQLNLTAACSHSNLSCATTDMCLNVTGCDINAGCQYENVTCPEPEDYCTLSICSSNVGCQPVARTCGTPDGDCYIGTCDSAARQCDVSQRPSWTTITTSKGNGVTCFAYWDKAATGATIAAGVVAGIVIAAVVFAALAAVGARKAYLYMQLRQGNMGAAQGNPLYAPSRTGGVNPLFAS